MQNTPTIFNRDILRYRRNKAAKKFSEHKFLICEVRERLSDRLLDIARAFPSALDLGSRNGGPGLVISSTGGIKNIISFELSEQMLREAGGSMIVGDAEFMPFRKELFDLVFSNLELHWINDLPGCLIQILGTLKPDGLFLGSIFGGGTLRELRDVLLTAELEVTGGASPRISPFGKLADVGGLLQRAGFALPVVDVDTIVVTYKNIFDLMADLKGMGESNVFCDRIKTISRRDIFICADELYKERYRGSDNNIRATFEIIYLHGWAPHKSQPQALKPGSAVSRLSKALDAKIPD